MPKTDGGPAFPTPNQYSTHQGTWREIVSSGGMSLRDWLAGQAIAGLLAWEEPSKDDRYYAGRAYAIADAMLKAREQS